MVDQRYKRYTCGECDQKHRIDQSECRPRKLPKDSTGAYLDMVSAKIFELVLLLSKGGGVDPYTYTQRERMGRAIYALQTETDRARNKAEKHGYLHHFYKNT